MKKLVLIAVFFLTITSFGNVEINNPDIINTNFKAEKMIKNFSYEGAEEYPNCFAFALAVYDAALLVGDADFAYNSMITAFNACTD